MPQSLALSPGSTAARSSLTNPLPGAAADASVQLAELIVEDSDDDHDDDPAHNSKTKSTSTFQTVKSRIRRHLSQDSLSRQNESEEQIARRAEVKRLLRKRIQEELRSEADVPPSTPPRLVSGQGKLGVNGPRDTIEFAVDEIRRDKELARFKAYHLAQSKEHQCRLSNPFFSDDKENRGLEGRAASLPDRVDAEEAELQAVEERFRDSHLRMEPLIPIESKFKEIFDHDGDLNAENRNYFLCRLHLNAQKRDKPMTIENLDGNGTDHITFVQEPSQRTDPRPHGTSSLERPDHGHLQVPVVDRGTNRRNLDGTSLGTSRKSGESGRPRGFSCSKQGDETAQMWKRALRAESKSKSPRGSTSSDVISSPSHLGVVCDLKGVPTAPQPSGNGSLNLSTPGIHSPTGDGRLSRDNDAKLRETVIRSSTILQNWAHQLESQESEARERSRNSGPASSPFVQATKMPLASWSRFPSYNREQRNAAAGQADNIKSKDFAVKEFSGAGELNWTTDKPHDECTLPKVVGRSFSDKVASTFKSRWSKLIPGRSGIPSRDGSMQGGRRSSIQTGGDLEYPELELLPSAGRYRELRALEREIDDMKGVKIKKRSSSDAFSTQPDRPRLTDKMVGAWQQPGAGSDAELSKTSDTTSFVEEKASMM
ncbi:hypothetical protein VSDG_07636 [Cytospora chrysosperma]|uniref:Uncharacterized protein n=1 Tax=Cytospora chrysosperma TaxID=252740 RepID=A0A423VM58_CYTCH|nr:hypothetical protein VSDG_07636 [Valsa sordida]